MSTLSIKELSHPSGEVIKIAAGKTLDLNSQGSVTMPTGSVLQVVSVTKVDTWTYTGSTTFQDVTGLSIAITPSSTSSKILVELNINLSASSRYSAVKLFRDSTQIGGGTAVGNRPSVSVAGGGNNDEANQTYVMLNSSTSYLDSPNTTSATTYKVQAGNTNNTSSVTYINRSMDDTNANYSHRGSSTLTITEIAQ